MKTILVDFGTFIDFGNILGLKLDKIFWVQKKYSHFYKTNHPGYEESRPINRKHIWHKY